MMRERIGHLPSYAESKKNKSLMLDLAMMEDGKDQPERHENK